MSVCAYAPRSEMKHILQTLVAQSICSRATTGDKKLLHCSRHEVKHFNGRNILLQLAFKYSYYSAAAAKTSQSVQLILRLPRGALNQSPRVMKFYWVSPPTCGVAKSRPN
jgi:hypothetical protein